MKGKEDRRPKRKQAKESSGTKQLRRQREKDLKKDTESIEGSDLQNRKARKLWAVQNIKGFRKEPSWRYA